MGFSYSTEEEHLIRMLLSKASYREIARQINLRVEERVPGFKTKRSGKGIEHKIHRDKYVAGDFASYTEIANPFIEQMDTIESCIRLHQEKHVRSPIGLVDIPTRKILCLSDFHFPFVNRDELLAILETHKDSSGVVLNGDLFDQYIYSTFPKAHRISALDEYRAIFAFVDMVRQKFPWVVITQGNHDVRASRALADARLPPEGTQIFRADFLARIVNGERLDATGRLIEKLKFDNVLYDQKDSFYAKIGKTLFIHPHNRQSGLAGQAAKFQQSKFQHIYTRDEVDCLVLGHTHHVFKGVIDGQLLIEQGCIANYLSYGWGARSEYKVNTSRGYAVIFQDKDGNTDFNRSNFVFLGTTAPPKRQSIVQ